MLRSEALALLKAVEARDRAALYKARWDRPAALKIVPKLTAALEVEDRDVRMRVLGALHTIGPLASSAAPQIAALLHSPELWLFQNAALALAAVSLNRPQPAVQPLIETAGLPGREKYAMFALIELGPAAQAAAPIFINSFQSPAAGIRRLALRGLDAIGADDATMSKMLRKAARDKSQEVRQYAAKLAARRKERQ